MDDISKILSPSGSNSGGRFWFSKMVDVVYAEIDAEDNKLDCSIVNRDEFFDKAKQRLHEKSQKALVMICKLVHLRAASVRREFAVQGNPEYTFRESYSPEWSDEEIIIEDHFNLFDCEITRELEPDILPEMVKLRQAYNKLHSHKKEAALPSAIFFLVYSIVLLVLANMWQQAGYPMILVNLMSACGMSDDAINELWLAPHLIVGSFIPLTIFGFAYLKTCFSRTMSIAGTGCLISGVAAYIVSEYADVLPQIIAQRIFLAYFVFCVLACLYLVVLNLYRKIAYSSDKYVNKQYVDEFLETMENHGPTVYAFIRLITLWYKHECQTDQEPALIKDISDDYRRFSAEAQALKPKS